MSVTEMTSAEKDAAIDRPIEMGCTPLWGLIDRLIEVAREPHAVAGTVGNLPVFVEGEQSVGAQFIDPVDEIAVAAPGAETLFEGMPTWMKETSPHGFTLIG